MPAGGDIHIRAYQKTERHLCISVEDQGFGIEKVRKAVYTTKENGTGRIGLMITYKIIKEHQGSTAIQSSVGIGTKVEIFLPIV